MQTECIFCKKAKELLQDKNSFEGKSLNFNGFIWEKLVLINNSFYLVFECVNLGSLFSELNLIIKF